MNFYSLNMLTGSERRESRMKMLSGFSTKCESSLHHHQELSGLGRGLGIGVAGSLWFITSPSLIFTHRRQ